MLYDCMYSLLNPSWATAALQDKLQSRRLDHQGLNQRLPSFLYGDNCVC